MDIEWRDLEGYEGLYQVSNDGRVRSMARPVYWADGSLNRISKTRVMAAEITNWGYRRLGLRRNGITKRYSVHRLVAQTFLADSHFPGAIVRHLDGNPLNNNVRNLAWGTASENQRDSIRLGTHHSCRPRGERKKNAEATA